MYFIVTSLCVWHFIIVLAERKKKTPLGNHEVTLDSRDLWLEEFNVTPIMGCVLLRS